MPLFRHLVFYALILIAPHAIAAPLLLVTAYYPPFAYEENGQQKGIAVDLAKEAFARMHQEIRIEFVPFPRAISMVKSGEADAIFPFAISEEREKFVRYPSERLVSDPATLFVRADSTIVFDADISKLARYSFGKQRDAIVGPSFVEALKKRSARIDESIDQEQNILKLVAGRFDIALGPSLVVQYAAKRIGKADEIKVLYSGVSDGAAYLAFTRQRDYSLLITQFEQTIRKMRRDGSYDHIFHAYAAQ
jgi:polar amino acid transport system substrate-binding protein